MFHRIASGFLLALLAQTASPDRVVAAPAEAPAELAISPGDPNLWVLRYDFGGGGFLYSQDAGRTWRLLCNAAVDRSLHGETTALAIAPSGKVFTGVFTGLWEIGAGGCGAEMVGRFDGQWVSDIANDPVDPNVVYAVTSSGARGSTNGIVAYDDATDRWVELGAREDILINRVRVARVDHGRRLYESAVDGELVMDNGDGTADYFSNHYIRYSDDEGTSWTTHAAFVMSAGRVRLEAVDPTNADRIIVSESFGESSERDRIWANDRAGEPDRYVLLGEVDELGGVAFAPDGRMWFADAQGGVFLVPAGETTPATVSGDVGARCLTHDAAGDRLLACRSFDVVELERDGTVTAVLDFRTQSEWVQCDGNSVAAQCAIQAATVNWCDTTHFPEAGVCAAYCYPGLNDMRVGIGGQCPPGTKLPGGEVVGDGDDPSMVDGHDGPGVMGDGDLPDAGRPTPPAGDRGGADGCRVGSRAGQACSVWLALAGALWWLRRLNVGRARLARTSAKS